MFANVALVASAIAAVTSFAAGPIMSVSIRPFEGLFTEAFLGSFFVTLLPLASSVTLLGMVSPFAIRVLTRRGGRDRWITDLTLLGYVWGGS
ncbi:MAG: hypothetical protein H0T57_00485 [Rubrobacter sp.]|nr:hypothetical protein [Rubrobacter sp.]